MVPALKRMYILVEKLPNVYERMREQMIKKCFGFCDSRSGGGTVKLWDSICRCIKARI